LKEKVEIASMGEAAVSGYPHADNVAASLLGGFTIVNEEFDVVRLDPPEMEIVIAIPEIKYENKTRHARGLLPSQVLLSNAVLNIMNASRMVAALNRGDLKLFGSSIRDNLIEPYRSEMIPNFKLVKKAALDAGAYGCSLAGGGPSIFAVGENPQEIGGAMREAFEDSEVECRTLVTNPSREGVRRL
jgi:homoserine kinase